MYEKLPRQLKQDGLFVRWRYEKDKHGRRTKVPHKLDGHGADITKQESYAGFSLVAEKLEGYDGLGIGLFKDLGLIDIDHCVTDGELSEMAKDIVEAVNSYTEISPSGTGIRIIVRVRDASLFSKERFYINNRKLKLEIYVAGVTTKFCTLTGNCIREMDVEERTEELLLIEEKYMLRPVPKKRDTESVPGSLLSDEQVLDKALNSKQGKKFAELWDNNIPKGKSPSEADQALATILAFWCGGDMEQMDRLFRTSGLMRDKWDSRRGETTYGWQTLQKAVNMVGTFYGVPEKSSAEDDFNDVLQKVKKLNPALSTRYTWDDTGSGRLFADIFKGMARFVPERDKWFVYDGIRWKADVGNMKTMELAKKLGDVLTRYAGTITEENQRTAYKKYCKRWQARGARGTYLSDAESVYPISMSEFDKDIYLLNCQNVTVDVRTGEVHDHNSEDKLTRLADVEYDAKAQSLRFSSFVDEVMSGDKDKLTFLQKSLGYGLTGDTKYECMFIYHGATTRNGKGTLMESVLNVMGDYGLSVRPETIAYKQVVNSQGPSEDIARLAGVRFANISEPRRGLVLNEAQIKSMTGNDTLNARFLHENSFDFKPQFKLFINTNYLPVITDMTLFSSGRIIIVPFDRHFEEWEQDKSLKAEFAKEEVKSAILNWLLEGYALLNKEGFTQPEAVRNATKVYQHDSDKVLLFAEECLAEHAGAEAKTSAVYKTYRTWCNNNGSYPENSRNFNQALRTIGEVVRKRPKEGGEKTTLLTGYNLLDIEFLA
jgi:putative DNA primase/helicase